MKSINFLPNTSNRVVVAPMIIDKAITANNADCLLVPRIALAQITPITEIAAML